MPTSTFYPSLATLIPLENIPAELGLLKSGLSNFFDHFYYRDLQINKSVDGDAAFYSLKIVTYKRLALEVPGTGGLALVLNPGLDEGSQGATSEFPISLSYKWGILKYVRDFDLESFDFSGPAFFNILLDLTGVTKEQLLAEALSVLTDDPDPVQQFIDLFNSDPNYNPAAPLLINSFPTDEEVISDLLVQLVTNGNDFDSYQIILDKYIVSINSPEEILEKLELLFAKWLGAFPIDDIKEMLTPEVSASIDALSVGIQFPSKILRQVNAQGKPIPDPQHPGEDKPAVLSFDVASLKYSTACGLEFDLADSLVINFPRSEILKSGLILDLHDVKVDFSRTSNIPEASADGRPVDFIGVYVRDGTISFPAFWKSAPGSTGVIKARNLLIGTGGFSGTLALEAIATGSSTPVQDPVVKFTFGKDPAQDPSKEFSVSLDGFKIVLKQNAIKESEIKGTLVIPGLKDANNKPAEIKIKVAIRQDGDFDITGHEADGFKTFKCGNIFDLTLKTVFLGKEDDDFYLGVGGSIKFTHDLIKTVVKDPIEIEKLIIWSDGRFEIKGGTIPLPKNIRFPIGPAELSITAIHMGSHQQIDSNGSIRNFRYFGFDGGVDISPGGVDVRGKGIKFFYPEDLTPKDCYLEIKSIAVDLVIPGSASKETATLLISGFLSMGGTKADPAWEGGVSFALPKAKIAGGASMALRPKVPAFIVDAFVELSTPIPLGSTSLGIYGFRGLFGQRYVATKAAAGLVSESDTWFDYYKALKPKQGVNISKFEGPSQTKSYDGAFSIGAGVSLATAQDDGKTFSCKLFLLLSLPDLIYLEGKANILGERVGLDGEDPPFFAMLAISSRSVELGAGVSYQLPRDDNKGWILDLNAEMRAAFFFQNSSAWYVNFGTIANPTTARILTIFDAYSYVMLSASGIAAGAGVSFGFTKSYAGGMVRASVGVYIKVGGFISFERPQIGGFAMLGGHVDVSLLKFSFYLVIDTSLSVEVPQPFYIQGSVHLCVGVTIGFKKFSKKIEKCFDVEFKWEKNPIVDVSGVLPFADLSSPNVPSPIMGTNMLSAESFKIAHFQTWPPSPGSSDFDWAVLPLDTWVDLEFLKGLLPEPDVDARIGRLSGQVPANTIDYVPPAEVAHKVKHAYSIKAVEIKAWNGNTWVEYRPYQAMSPPDALTVLKANPSLYKDGYWQNSGSGFNKLRLLAETSLSYMQQGQPGWYMPEQFGITSATLFCRTNLREMHCLSWIKVAAGTVSPADAWRQVDTVLYRVSGGLGTVIDWTSPFSIPRSLVFPNQATVQIVFNKPCVEVNLKLTTFSSGVLLRFYKRQTVGNGFEYALVETRALTQLQLLAQVQYNNPAEPVAKVEVDPIKAEHAAIAVLQIEIDALYRQINEKRLEGKEKEALIERIQKLEHEIVRLNDLECRPKGINKETLSAQVTVLERDIQKCREHLAAFLYAQQQVCKEAADLRDQFGRCFPSVPSTLSYEVLKVPTLLTNGFGFRIYDDLTNTVVLNSVHLYRDSATAESALFETLELTPYLGDYALMAPRNSPYFFQLVDTSGQFIAVSPAQFTQWDQLVELVEKTRTMFLAARAGGKFILERRVGGKLPCDESLSHLACWNQLPFLGAAGKNQCKTIVDGMLSAREVFCREYNKLYRELYACNKRLLDDLTSRCEEMTHQVEIKHAACQALTDQLAAVQQLLTGQADGLVPPKGFPCTTLLHEVCNLSLEDYEFNISAPGQDAIVEDYANAVGAIEKMLTPIWRPGTKYGIRLQLGDTVTAPDGVITAHDSEAYFGFRTAGPLGYFHTDPSADYIKPGKTAEQYMLTGLKGYIDYQRSYPNADGELVRAKPLFYEDARILLFFAKRYVYHFFADWPAYNGLPALSGNAMQIIIKDPAENSSIPNPPPPEITTTEIPQAVVSWPSDEDPGIPEDIRTLLNLHNPKLLNPDFEGGDCWVSGGQMIKPACVYTSVEPKYLKPLKLYTAVVNNVYGEQPVEVHQYVFQTSMYPDFVAQIDSYRLDDGKGNRQKAIYPIDVPLSVADIDLMYDVVAGNTSPANTALAGTWADPFDRLVAGVMKLKPLDAAISTEFNVVRNSNTGAAVAVWIRNPEPFNDPKLPDDVMKRSLRVMDGLNVDSSYDVLFSKECSQVFVMHPAKVIPVTVMKFRFAYIEWDGSEYVDRTVVFSGLIPTNI